MVVPRLLWVATPHWNCCGCKNLCHDKLTVIQMSPNTLRHDANGHIFTQWIVKPEAGRHERKGGHGFSCRHPMAPAPSSPSVLLLLHAQTQATELHLCVHLPSSARGPQSSLRPKA